MKILIGIDVGKNNGFAVWMPEKKQFQSITTKKTWQVMFALDQLRHISDVHVYIESPTTWKPFTGQVHSNARLQGVGSVKARYNALVEFMEDNGIAYTPTRIQGTLKKLSAEQFQRLTGWKDKTNEHGRDAAMIVFERNK